METIKEAATKALEILGKPSSVQDILNCIVSQNLYTFNSDDAEHVLATTLRRHAENVTRSDSHADVLFVHIKDSIFWKAEKTAERRLRTLGVKRIHRAKDKEGIISDLTSSELGVFKEIWRLLVFAAMLGFQQKRRSPLLEVDQGKGIDQATFGNSPVWPGILYLVALSETESEEVMRTTENTESLRITLFEEYANGGLEILQEYFAKADLDLTSLVGMANDHSYGVLNDSASPDLAI